MKGRQGCVLGGDALSLCLDHRERGREEEVVGLGRGQALRDEPLSDQSLLEEHPEFRGVVHFLPTSVGWGR